MAELKAYINRDSNGKFIPGSVVYSKIKPKNGNYALIVAGVEQNNSVISNPEGVLASAYTSVIRKTYPRAVVASQFADGIIDWIKGDGYFPENVLLSETLSDDIGAPVFSNLKNVGQRPERLSEFAGPFKAGGLGGYPHTGKTGYETFVSHEFTTDKKNALFIMSTVPVGISKKGNVGRVERKGKVSDRSDKTSGPIAKAIDFVVKEPNVPKVPLIDDAQYDKLINLLHGARESFVEMKAGKGETIFEARMKLATSLLVQRNKLLYLGDGKLFKSWITDHKSNFESATLYADNLDIYYINGTFINTDYGTPAHIDIESFVKTTNQVQYQKQANREREDALKRAEADLEAAKKKGDAEGIAKAQAAVAAAKALPEFEIVRVGTIFVQKNLTKEFIKSL